MRKNLNNWTLNEKSWKESIKAEVPGDITVDLYKAGKVPDPYFGLNHKEIRLLGEKNYTYETTFTVDKEFFEKEEIYLNFEGIDTYSEIYLNI